MNAIAALASLLAPAAQLAEPAPLALYSELDRLIASLQQRLRIGSASLPPIDHQQDALQRFWREPRLTLLRDARLVAFGLGLPVAPSGACLFDDPQRLTALLDGIDQWRDEPRRFRRCYQGLLRCYFEHNTGLPEARNATRANWERLRDYLARRAGCTRESEADPDWVATLLAHPHLFGETPCLPHVAALLQGRREVLDRLCTQLGIDSGSWFLRDLVGAQVDAAVRLADEPFQALLPALLQALAGTHALRDGGLAMLLDRHAACAQPPLHEGLRDALLEAWGSPMVAAHELHWRGVSDAAREMATGWAKAAALHHFFAHTGRDADGRRAAFWQRYLRAIQRVDFAAAPAADAASPRPDRDPWRGMTTLLRDGAVGERAIVIRLGCAVLVAFDDPLQPLQLHDLRQGEPFDLSRAPSARPDAENSLRPAGRGWPLSQRDGGDGWRQWEQRIEAALKERFDIRPGALAPAGAASFIDLSGASLAPRDDEAMPPRAPQAPASAGEDVHWQTAEAASVPYSRPDLEVFARVHALRLDDRSAVGGKLWVLTDASDPRIARVLARWGFGHVAGQGWSR